MKEQKFYAVFLSVLSGLAMLLTGCKSPGTIEVAALHPVPLSFAEETIAEALAKFKSTPINPDAISRQDAVQYILSRDIYAKASASPVPTDGSGASNASASKDKSSVNDTLAASDFTEAGGLLKNGTLQINSRNTISNLADLYEWRIANELLFSLQKSLPQYDFYYVPAMVTITPGPKTYRDFYVRVTFAVKIYEDDLKIYKSLLAINTKKPEEKISYSASFDCFQNEYPEESSPCCFVCNEPKILNNYFVYCNKCDLCNRSWWDTLIGGGSKDSPGNEKYSRCTTCKLCKCPNCRQKLSDWKEKNDGEGRDSEIHLFALSPFRQFDNQSESLSSRRQFLATLAAAATAKAGPANVTLDSYYSTLTRMEKDFAQITKAPVVTSFASSNRRIFGWDIYPSPKTEGGEVINVMTPDSWRFSAIIAVKKKSAPQKILVTPKMEWIRLSETYTWFTTDKIEMPDIEPFVMILENDPVILRASAESAYLVRVSGICLDRLCMDDLKVYPIDGKDEMKFTYSYTSDSSILLQLTDKTMEDKKTYRVVWTGVKNNFELGNGTVPYGGGQFAMTAVDGQIQGDNKGKVIGEKDMGGKESFTVTFVYKAPPKDNGSAKPTPDPDPDPNAKKYKLNITLDGSVTEPKTAQQQANPETN